MSWLWEHAMNINTYIHIHNIHIDLHKSLFKQLVDGRLYILVWKIVLWDNMMDCKGSKFKMSRKFHLYPCYFERHIRWPVGLQDIHNFISAPGMQQDDRWPPYQCTWRGVFETAKQFGLDSSNNKAIAVVKIRRWRRSISNFDIKLD